MSFDSAAYLLFLPAAVLLYWLCPHRGRWAVLLCASVLFYGSWSGPLTGLLLAEAGAAWLAGLFMARWNRSPAAGAGAGLGGVFRPAGVLQVF